MVERRYKYRREDFGDLPVELRHLTIYLNFRDDRVEADNCLEMISKQSCDRIELDAGDLEIKRVEWCKSSGHLEEGLLLDYEYDRKRNKLVIRLPHLVEQGKEFCIRTLSHCFPSDHILEGIYKDATPPGAPQQYMSQCQQWGFQRIMPIFDDCRAKCTMTTTIEADRAYTHLITNGTIDRRLNPKGRPVPKANDPSRQVIRYENRVPMAPYLFLVCVGTWDELVDQVRYESGNSVRLEYLVPPGSADQARIPMDILKKAIPWIKETQDYEYTGDTYRTICMNKSNFGGMENVGNTTIVTDAALINEHTLDLALLYAHAVIVHEFEHNQCGSETTMDTPFDVWLNEAYTVDVERQFMADLFDPSFIRLQQVDSIRNPLLGPLAIENAGHAGRIVRDGFNDPDELIDGVTYVKAAEVIRMLHLVLGPEDFRSGKTLYFSRYRNGNANTDQFFQCFEEVSGRSLECFKKEWLYRIGYPKVTATTHYEEKTKRFKIHFEQEIESGQMPFHMPIELALVDFQGMDVTGTCKVFEITGVKDELTFENVEEVPAFPSMNRDYSFYGTFLHKNATSETLALQARKDPNAYNRVDAMRQLTDQERIKLLLDTGSEVSSQWIDLYGMILRDEGLPSSLKAYFLRIDEQPLNLNYATWYQELVAARERLMLSVNSEYRKDLLGQFERLDTYTPTRQSLREGIENRMLKQVLLDIITVDDSSDSHRLILDHYRSATTANDRVAALMALNRSSEPTRLTVLEQVFQAWHTHLSGYANYLRIVSGGTREDVFDMIEIEKNRKGFDITQPTWCRALFLPMAANNKMVWTDRGVAWVADTVIQLAPFSPTITGRLLNTFQHVRKLKYPLQEKVKAALERIVQNVPEETSPAVHGQATTYLG